MPEAGVARWVVAYAVDVDTFGSWDEGLEDVAALMLPSGAPREESPSRAELVDLQVVAVTPKRITARVRLQGTGGWMRLD